MKFIIKILIVVVVVAGCNGASLTKLGKQLNELEMELVDARNADDAAAESAVSDELRQLATKAENAAGKARAPEDTVSYYRIAATAAWQGQSPEVVELGASGFDKCEEIGLATAPTRDCFMLRVIPDLAATDQLTARLDQAKLDIAAERDKPPAERSAETLERIGGEGDDIFDGYQRRFGGLVAAEDDFADIALPEGLDELHDKNKDFVYCRLRDALAVQTLSIGMNDSRFQANQAELELIRQNHDPDNEVNCAAT